jgi:tripeptide aminopeptidase
MDDAGTAVGGDTGNLIIRVPGTGPGQARAFSAHMDCVPPCIGVQPVLKDGVITSLSDTILGGDDKAGIAAILEALQHLKEEDIPHPELYLLFTIGEENGLVGAKNLDYSLVGAQEVVVLDACGDVGTIITRSPAKTDLTITFHGRTAHAGIEPEKGISAIQIAAAAIGRMQLLRIDERTVANLGRIEGGSQTNIVADQVVVTGEVRAQGAAELAAQIEHMRSCCVQAAEEFGGSVSFIQEPAYPALHTDPDAPLPKRVLEACARLGLRAAFKGTGGGSDANIFAARGISAVTLSIGMSRVHTTDEFITVDSLVQTARLTAELMRS